MKWTLRLLLVMTVSLLSSLATALTIKGIDLPDEVTIDQTPLLLNGAGIRSKFVFDIYVGALYLSSKTNSAEAIINDPGPKLVSMHFVYDDISAEKMRSGWTDGFAKVLDDAGLKQLQAQIDAFNQAFGDTKAGDVIKVRYIPQNGTTVIVNNTARATIPGVEFHQALMRIWLGDDPVDSDLKKGMLGNKE